MFEEPVPLGDIGNRSELEYIRQKFRWQMCESNRRDELAE